MVLHKTPWNYYGKHETLTVAECTMHPRRFSASPLPRPDSPHGFSLFLTLYRSLFSFCRSFYFLSQSQSQNRSVQAGLHIEDLTNLGIEVQELGTWQILWSYADISDLNTKLSNQTVGVNSQFPSNDLSFAFWIVSDSRPSCRSTYIFTTA